MALTAKFRDAFHRLLPKHPKQILVADNDATHFFIAHPKTLPLFASPLHADDEHGHGHQHQQHHATSGQDYTEVHSSDSSLPREKQNAHVQTHHLRSADGEPPLKRAHESSVIQLFYDLFFVANLTTFTSVHEINDANTLKSYVGFFGILWFTWLQVAMFDIRFGVDSVFERICKGLQFGVMTGFAVVGPAYHVGWDAEEGEKAAQSLLAFQSLSLILMASRLILFFQYGIVLVWMRRYKKTWAPMFIHMLVLFVAAMIFLGLYFSFGKESGDNSLIAWYVVVALEGAVILLISAKYKFLSFRKTCIVERLGLLTLIILGEGVIGLCSSIQKVGSDQQFGSDIIGMIICGVFIIYAQWMLYFDQTETDRVGTVRQLIWTIVHFPYHVSILLLVEGVSQLSVWRKLLDYWFGLIDSINAIPNPRDEEEIPEIINKLNETMQEFFNVFNENLGKLKFQVPYIDDDLVYLGDLYKDYFNNNTDAANSTNTTEAIGNIWGDVYSMGANFAADNLGIEPPEFAQKEAQTPDEYLNSLFDTTFQTVFLYMFICAGFTLIFTSVLFFFGKRHKVRGDYLNIGFRMLMGLGLALLSIMATSSNADYQYSYDMYTSSAWILPTVTIVFAIVVIIDKLLINYVRHLVKKPLHSPSSVMSV